MVLVTIRLVGEEKDRLFKRIELDPQIQVDDLVKKIESLTNILPKFQEIKFRGDELPDVERPLQDIKFAEELVVKHSHLGHWNAYLNRVEEFKNAQVKKTKKSSAESAQRFYDLLLGSSFFTVYPNFDIAVTKHHKPISKYLDKHTYWIQNAARNFFALSMFKGQNPEIEFEETNDGTRSAVICKITVNSITHKYRIKTNHNAGECGQASRWNLDLIELYCYKLLDSIGVGPNIVFIPNCVASKTILYIGSKWLADFQSFNSTEEVNTTEISHAVVQIHFLAVFLSLGDMHEENFGINESCHPIILDFMMSNYGDPKHKFLHEDNVIRSIRAREILHNCDSTTRLQIVKDAIRKWNLIDKLGEVLELMCKEKEDFGLKMLDFDKKIRDLEEFVEKVRSNIQDLSRE
ncbi:unnamed protein product [Caenorhabditis bovis]|uniref:Ubiquitin-like domain-containing protein n=1 Tax=Caenorhabditis bovis TaxID=2654633 RepID=A0A8S1EQ34_9PELO|nr:unnamed protein product [Caenorhabditis bovis]